MEKCRQLLNQGNDLYIDIAAVYFSACLLLLTKTKGWNYKKGRCEHITLRLKCYLW